MPAHVSLPHLALAALLVASPGQALSLPQDQAPSQAPTRPAGVDDADQAETPDPPGRVGRLARADGGVSLRLPGDAAWGTAQPNLPIASGTALWAEPGGRALLELPGLTLALEGGSQLEFPRIDDDAVHATLAQGSLGLLVQGLRPGDQLSITTPRGTATIRKPGRYLLDAGDEGTPTRLAVYAGQAEFTPADGAPQRLAAGQALVVEAAAVLEPIGPPSPLLAWAESRGPKGGPHPESLAFMPGAAVLSQYGQWSRHPEYGDVWRPQVASGWTPFLNGQWRNIEPWGWTWIDDAPWGFAPAHYGRWYQDSGAWYWAPQPIFVARLRWPVYAPAVVRFGGGWHGHGHGPGWGGGHFGGGPRGGPWGGPGGGSWGGPRGGHVGAWGGGHPVRWVPLGPREAFWPNRPVSPRWVARVNGGAVPPGFGPGPRPGDFARLANARAALGMPASAMQGAGPVAANARRLDAREMADFGAARLPPPMPRGGAGPVDGMRGPPGLVRGAAASPGARPPLASSADRALLAAPRMPGAGFGPSGGPSGSPNGSPNGSPGGNPSGNPSGNPGATRPGSAGNPGQAAWPSLSPGALSPGALSPGAMPNQGLARGAGPAANPGLAPSPGFNPNASRGPAGNPGLARAAGEPAGPGRAGKPGEGGGAAGGWRATPNAGFGQTSPTQRWAALPQPRGTPAPGFTAPNRAFAPPPPQYRPPQTYAPVAPPYARPPQVYQQPPRVYAPAPQLYQPPAPAFQAPQRAMPQSYSAPRAAPAPSHSAPASRPSGGGHRR